MPRRLDASHLQLIAADAGRAPLRGLSCPSAPRDDRPPLHRSLRSFGPRGHGAERPRHAAAAANWRWGDALITDVARRPTKRRRVRWTLVALAAFMLAAILAQVG